MNSDGFFRGSKKLFILTVLILVGGGLLFIFGGDKNTSVFDNQSEEELPSIKNFKVFKNDDGEFSKYIKKCSPSLERPQSCTIYHVNHGALSLIDSESFEFLGSEYIKDESGVYWRNEQIEEADLSSFRWIGSNYAIDNSNFYRRGEVKPEVSIEGIEVVHETPEGAIFMKNNSSVYIGEFRLHEIENADPSTFKVLEGQEDRSWGEVYSTDGEEVFIGNRVLEVAEPDMSVKELDEIIRGSVPAIVKNPDSFEWIGGSHYGTDAASFDADFGLVYYEFGNTQRALEGVSPSDFEVLAKDYGKTSDSIYYQGRVLEGVDPKSFELLAPTPSFSNIYFAKDRDQVFRGSEVLNKVDADTVEVAGGGYLKDRNNVYYAGKNLDSSEDSVLVLDGVNPSNFESLGNGWGRTENELYIYDELIGEVDFDNFVLIDQWSGVDSNYIYRKTEASGSRTKY